MIACDSVHQDRRHEGTRRQEKLPLRGGMYEVRRCRYSGALYKALGPRVGVWERRRLGRSGGGVCRTYRDPEGPPRPRKTRPGA